MPEVTCYLSSLEINGTIAEAVNAYHNVAKWSKPERAPWSFNFFAMKPTIRKEPKGVVGGVGEVGRSDIPASGNICDGGSG